VVSVEIGAKSRLGYEIGIRIGEVVLGFEFEKDWGLGRSGSKLGEWE